MNFTFETIFRSGPFYNFQIFSDATLQSKDGAIFHVHKMVLATHSEYFRGLFRFDINQKEFYLPKMESCILEQVLVFLYTNKLTLILAHIPDFLIASDFLLIEKLAKKCCRFAMENIDIANCLSILNVAWSLQKMSLFEHYYRFAQLNFQAIIENRTNDFGSLPIEILKLFLAEKSLNISSEKPMWQAICTWMENDLSERLIYVPELLTHLDSESINESLATIIINHSIVRENKYCNVINELKADNPSRTVLKFYMFIKGNPVFSARQARMPSFLNVIVNLSPYFGIQLFITFDEKFDVCRKIADLHFFPEASIVMNHKLHLFDIDDEVFSWDLVENVETTISDTFLTVYLRHDHSVVLSNGTVYCIEKKRRLFRCQVRNNIVQRYTPEMDEWDLVAPIPQMRVWSVIGCCDKLYAFGQVYSDGTENMLSQMYNPETDEWSAISPRVVERYYGFITAQYQNKLLLIGGYDEEDEFVYEVEEYDPMTDSWSLKPEIPIDYSDPKSTILNDNLYIYENSKMDEWQENFLNPPVFWDNEHQSWEIVEESSPLFHLKRFLICPINNPETIKRIIRNREISGYAWEESLFD